MEKVLNLYCGIGGNRKLWENVEVTAVDNNEKILSVYANNFKKDKVVCADAHKYLLDHFFDFDFIWSSPPCQSHSKMNKATRHKKKIYPEMSLYQEILFLKHFFKGNYVVENVVPYYEVLIKPNRIIGRHLFWSNFFIDNISIPPQPKNFINMSTKKDVDKLKEWIGINYAGNIYYGKNHCPAQVLRNCVHPLIGKQIFAQRKNKPLQLDIFNSK